MHSENPNVNKIDQQLLNEFMLKAVGDVASSMCAMLVIMESIYLAPFMKSIKSIN